MSGTASNYNIRRLCAGIAIASLATVVALSVSGKAVLNARSTGLWMASIAVTYAIMMFASSYVEEEQQFWYWATSSWLGWLLLKALVCLYTIQVDLVTDSRSHRCTKQGVLPSISAVVLLRMVRKWNQTGQKHAGAPDIARTILSSYNRILWLLILATYFNITQRLARKVLPRTSRHISATFSIALCIATLVFKISFTNSEAPELLLGLRTDFLRPISEISLVLQSQVVFIGIGTLTVLTILAKAFQKSREKTVEGYPPRCRTSEEY